MFMFQIARNVQTAQKIVVSHYLQIQTYHLNAYEMAPFRFDIEYFSIVVVLRETTEDEVQYFMNQSQKEAFIAKAKNNEFMSPKDIKALENRNFYNRKVQKQQLYFIVQNKHTLQFYASIHKNQTMEMQTKTIFPDVLHLYSYVRSHCNSDLIKMTKRGNLIIDYFIKQTIYQLKIDNQPFPLPSTDIEDIWKELKWSWDNRKQNDFDSSQKYLRYVKRGSLQLSKKVPQNSNGREYRNQIYQMSHSEIDPQARGYSQKESSRQLQSIKTPDPSHKKIRKYQKHMQKKHSFQADSSEQESQEIASERLNKTNKYLRYREEEESPRYERPTPKQHLRQKKEIQVRKRKYQRQHHKTMRKQEFQRNSNLHQQYPNSFQIKKRPHSPNTISLQSSSRIEQSLKRIEYSLEELQKQSGDHVIQTINQYLTYKMDQIIQSITQNFNKQTTSLNKISNQLQPNQTTTFNPISTDQVVLKAYSLFCQEKEEIFTKEFQLPCVSTRENMQRIWIQLGSDGRQPYIEKAQKQLNSKKNSKKYTKKEPLKVQSQVLGNRQNKNIHYQENKSKKIVGPDDLNKKIEFEEESEKIINQQLGPLDENDMQQKKQ